MKALNLVLHCGAHKAELDQVFNVRTPDPVGIWHPIPHLRLYEQVALALRDMNMSIVHEQHALSHDGARYFGLLQVANCQSLNGDYAYVVGLRNSHDKTFPAGLVVGNGVFVCDNLSFSGEIKIARKHTTFIERDLPQLTARAVCQLRDKWTDADRRFDAYKARLLEDRQVHDLMIRGLDIGACTAQQIPHVVKEWRHPRHPEFEQCGKTGWRLFNAFTEVNKDGAGIFALPKRTQALHALLDSECMPTCEVVNDEDYTTRDPYRGGEYD